MQGGIIYKGMKKSQAGIIYKGMKKRAT